MVPAAALPDREIDAKPMRGTLRPGRSSRLLLGILLLFAGGVVFPLPLRADEPGSAATESASEQVSSRIQAILEGDAPKTAADLREMQRRTRQLIEKIWPATVGLRVGQAQGSGVIVSADGYVLTAAHVIQRPGLPVDVVLHDGRIVRGKTLGLDRASDAGMVKIDKPPAEGEDWPFLEIGDSEDLRLGEWCLVLGHPGGYQAGRRPVVRFGRVLALEDDLVVTDCTLVGGDSGGPLLDMDGKVVGIHSRIGGSLTANMHVPTAIYQDSWERLVRGEMWGDVPSGAPYIGVRGDENLSEARIVSVEPGQPADRAGMKPGAIVLSFGGKPVTNFASLAGLVSDSEPGDKVAVEVQRGEEVITLSLVVGRRR